MGGKTLDQFNSRQQARAKKTLRDKDTDMNDPDDLNEEQIKREQHKPKY